MANTEPLVIEIRAEDETKQAFDSAERNQKKLEKSVKETLKRMEDYKNTIGMTADELQIYKLRQNKATEAQIQQAQKLQNLIALEKKKMQSSKGLNGQLRLIRGGFGQLGHQVQDVAVQLQGGTDAMIVMGQQGGQIASIFGPGGAIIGAFLAVGAAVSTAFRNVETAENKFDELRSTLEDLIPTSNSAARSVGAALEGITQAQLGKARGELDSLVSSMEDQVEAAEESLLITKKEFQVRKNQNPLVAQTLYKDATVKATQAVEEQTQAVEQNLAQFNALVSTIESLGGSVESATRPDLVNRIIALQDALRGDQGDKSPLAFTPEEVIEGKRGIEEIVRTLMNNREKIQAEYDDLRASLVDNFTKTGEMGSARFLNMYRQINKAQTDAIAEIDASEEEQAKREKDRAAAKAARDAKAAQAKVDAEKRAISTLEALQRSDVTDLDKINKRYDAELDRARKAADGRSELAQRLADTEVAIEAKRSAAIQSLRDKERQAHFDNIEKLRTTAIDGFASETEAYINNLVSRQAALEEAKANEAITLAEFNAYSMQLEEQKAEHMLDQQLKIIGGLQNVENAITSASTAFITGSANGTEAMRMLGKAIMDELIKSLVQMGIEKAKQAIIAKNIEAGSLAASVGANAAAMTAIAAASAPAAALVSLATMGGNAIPAQAGIASTVGVAKASALASFEGGGFTGSGARSGGMDGRGGFLAMLHPNETVIDHNQGGGQGITIVNNIDASGNEDVDQRIAMAVTESSRQTVEQVHNMMRRGRM